MFRFCIVALGGATMGVGSHTLYHCYQGDSLGATGVGVLGILLLLSGMYNALAPSMLINEGK